MSTAQTWDPETYARNARFVSDLVAGGGAARAEAGKADPRPRVRRRGVLTPLSFLDGLSGEARAEYLNKVRAALEPQLRGADGAWVADYVRLRFAAVKV
jgi:hypothetical protein